MISFIVPVFNAEGTLRRCVDSILAQTNPDLEVILIDDGSTDGSGIIADEYAAADSRVKALHKENGGLSSARNYGLDRARGEYILFVDADDWIEPMACEILIKKCKDADICIFGHFIDRPLLSRESLPSSEATQIGREEAMRKLIAEGSIRKVVWDKLYKKELFTDICFPEGFNYEDVRTTYRLFWKARSIVLIPDALYHYIPYKDSISHTQSAKNRLDHWTAYYEIYRAFAGTDEEYENTCFRRCMRSIFSAWASLWKTDRAEREKEKDRIQEIVRFAGKYRKEALRYGPGIWIAAVLASTGTRWSMFCAYIVMQPRNHFKDKKLFSKKHSESSDTSE